MVKIISKLIRKGKKAIKKGIRQIGNNGFKFVLDTAYSVYGKDKKE